MWVTDPFSWKVYSEEFLLSRSVRCPWIDYDVGLGHERNSRVFPFLIGLSQFLRLG